MRLTFFVASFATLLGGCTISGSKDAKDSAKATQTDSAVAPSANADADRQTGGSGLPAGFVGRTDNPSTPITGAKYTASGDGWEVVTGPAHIIYRDQDVASGSYTASATIEQLEKPAHPESYGIFVGGKNLDKPAQAYTYFLVRGTGELAVKVREGDKTREVLKWTAAANVPTQDASGKASYALTAQVTGDAIKFMVNGKQVASVSKVGLPTDGIAGLRINHNLHVKTSPISVKTP
jgi:hypothetical protein